MAQIYLELTATFTPAFAALKDCALAIAERHGEARASEWAAKTLRDDFDLFCTLGTHRKPKLRVIEGGK